MGIKTLLNYAVSEKIKSGRTITKVPIDKDKLPIEDVTGPLDPRLVYRNIPQVLLAKKMIMRGEIIPPNTRLEFLYLNTPGWEHQGDKAEDYTYYYENKDIENLKPDYLHYIEKQLKKPIKELLGVRYPKKIIPCISLEDRFRNEISNLNDLHRVRLVNVKTFNKKRNNLIIQNVDKHIVGWKIWFGEKKYNPVSLFSDKLSEDLLFTGYNYNNNDARITHAIDEMKHGTGKLTMSKRDYPELFELCHYWKSINIINRLHKKHGLPCRKWLSLLIDKDKIRVKSKIIMVKNFNNIKEGTVCKIINRTEQGSKKDIEYFYDLWDERTDTIEKVVARKYFTTFIISGENIMDNIYEYRANFNDVINELNGICTVVQNRIINYSESFCESEYD
jgi:hypothetical protein